MIGTIRTRGKGFFVAVCLFGILSLSVRPAYAVDTSIVTLVGKNVPTIATVAAACYAGALLQSGLSTLKDLVSGVADTEVSVHDNSVSTAIQKQNCGRRIERAAAQIILRSITLSTVDWINHGFNGNPLYPKDTSALLGNIRDQTIKDFSSSLGFDTKNYPFGRNVAKQLTNQIKQTFAERARYSLDNVIAQRYPGSTTLDFMNNFATGGWEAFQAQFDVANNPIGFTFTAESELSSRLDGTDYSQAQNIRDQLQRSGGLLDVTKCVSPATYDAGTSPDKAAKAHDELQNALATELSSGSSPLLTQLEEHDRQVILENTCTKTVTQTPGSAVSSMLNTTLNIPSNSLINGQDLAADLTAIFDALANQLVQKGFASLSSSNGDTKPYANNTTTVPNVRTVTTTTATGGGTGGGTTGGTTTSDGSQWYNQNSGQFNLLTGLPGVIANEQTVEATLVAQNDAANKIIPALYRLDLCVPGPRPGWDTDAENKLSQFVSLIPFDWNHMTPGVRDQMNAVLGDPTVGNGLYTERMGNGFYATTESDAVKNSRFYGTLLYLTTGILPSELKSPFILGYDNINSSLFESAGPLNDRDSIVSLIQTVYSRYKEKVGQTYNLSTLPTEAAPGAQEYKKIPLYQEGIAENNTLIQATDATIRRIQLLKDRLDPITARIQADPKYKAEYATLTTGGNAGLLLQSLLADPNYSDLKDLNDAFIRASASLHTDSDVTTAQGALSDLNQTYDFIAKPGSGLTNQCLLETSQSGYPFTKTRVTYPTALSNNPDALATGVSFFPTLPFGSDAATSIKSTDLVASYPSTGGTTAVAGITLSGKSVGSLVCPTTSTAVVADSGPFSAAVAPAGLVCPTTSAANPQVLEHFLGVY